MQDYRSSSYKARAKSISGGYKTPSEARAAGQSTTDLPLNDPDKGSTILTQDVGFKQGSVVSGIGQVAIGGGDSNYVYTSKPVPKPVVSNTTTRQVQQSKSLNENEIKVGLSPALYGALKNQRMVNGESRLGSPGLYALGTNEYFASVYRPSGLDVQREIGNQRMKTALTPFLISAAEAKAQNENPDYFDYFGFTQKSTSFAKSKSNEAAYDFRKGRYFEGIKDVGLSTVGIVGAVGGTFVEPAAYAWFTPSKDLKQVSSPSDQSFGTGRSTKIIQQQVEGGFQSGMFASGLTTIRPVAEPGSFSPSRRTLKLFQGTNEGLNPTEVTITPEKTLFAKQTISGPKSVLREDLGLEVVTSDAIPTDKYRFLGKSYEQFTAKGNLVPGDKKLGFGFLQTQEGGISYLKRSGKVFDYFAVSGKEGKFDTTYFYKQGKATGKFYDLGMIKQPSSNARLFGLTEPTYNPKSVRLTSPLLESGGQVPDFTQEFTRQIGKMDVVGADYSGRFRPKGQFFIDVQGTNTARTIKRGFNLNANLASEEGTVQFKQTVYKFEDGLLPKGEASSFRFKGGVVDVDKATFGKVDIQQGSVVRGFLDFPSANRKGGLKFRMGKDAANQRLFSVKFGKDVAQEPLRFKFGGTSATPQVNAGSSSKGFKVEGLSEFSGMRMSQSVSQDLQTKFVSRGGFSDMDLGLGSVKLPGLFNVGKVSSGFSFTGFSGGGLVSRGRVKTRNMTKFRVESLSTPLLSQGTRNALRQESSSALRQDARVGLKSDLGLRQRSFLRLRPSARMDTKPSSITELRLDTRLATQLDLRQRATTTPRPRNPTPIFKVPTPPITPPPFVPFIPFKPSASFDNYSSLRNFKAARITKYTPSFNAFFYNIGGKYKKGKLSKSGLDFRPVTNQFRIGGVRLAL